MRRYGKWTILALVAAALVVTITLSMGWTASGLAGDIALLAACYK